MASSSTGERERLQEAVERDREDLRRAIERLSSLTRSRLRPGAAIGRRPGLWVLAGFLAGGWLGLRAGRGGTG